MELDPGYWRPVSAREFEIYWFPGRLWFWQDRARFAFDLVNLDQTDTTQFLAG